MDTAIVTRLRALADHLDTHPDLVDRLAGIDPDGINGCLKVLVFGRSKPRTSLGELAAWARSFLNPPETVKITVAADDNSCSHLQLIGRLSTGTPVDVTTIVEQHDDDLLAANVRVEAGAMFPVELLLRLTDHVAAETLVGDAKPERFNPIRYFQDSGYNRWRVHPDGLVQIRWSDADQWELSANDLASLIANPNITEVPDRSQLPAVPPYEIQVRARELALDGKKIPAIKLVREHTCLGLREAKLYVDGFATAEQVTR